MFVKVNNYLPLKALKLIYYLPVLESISNIFTSRPIAIGRSGAGI